MKFKMNQYFAIYGIIILSLNYCNEDNAKDNLARGMAIGALGMSSVAQGNANSAASNASTSITQSCFNCHSETTDTGNKIQWARAGWSESVHANGYKVPIWGTVPVTTSAVATTDPTVNTSYFSNSYTAVTNYTWAPLGYEWEGSDAFYSNGGGCQICHTKEGFRNKIGSSIQAQLIHITIN